MIPNAIDISYTTFDPASCPPEIELVVQDLWTGAEQPASRVTNLRAAHDAGKRIAGYFAVNPSLPDNAAMARAGVPDDLWPALVFVAPDVELYTTLTAAKVRAESERMSGSYGLHTIEAAPQRPRVLYTREDFWRHTLGDDASFGDHLLWDARPGRAFSPYGAWLAEADCIGVQTSSTSQLGTMSVDFDWFNLEALMGAPAQPAPAAALMEARIQLVGAVLTNDMARLVADLVLFGVLPAGTAALKLAL